MVLEIDVTELKSWKHGFWRSPLQAIKDGASLDDLRRLIELEDVVMSAYYDEGIEYQFALTKASSAGDLAVVKRLLEVGARDVVWEGIDPERALRMPPYRQTSAIEVAARNQHLELVCILLQAQEKEVSRNKHSTAALERAMQSTQQEEVARLVRTRDFLKLISENKEQALKEAAGLGNIQVARRLVEAGTEVNPRRHNSQTALEFAAKGAHIDMVDYLLSVGANIAPPGRPHQALASAAASGSLEIVEKFLQAGAVVHEGGILHAASSKGHVLVVKRLLEAGASVHELLYSDYPLQMAIRGGHLNVVNVLIQASAELDSPAASPSIQLAAEGGFIDIAKMLLARGCDVNKRSRANERTALQSASERGDIEMVNILIGAGAELTSPFFHEIYTSSLELAAKGGHLSVVDKLLRVDRSLPRVGAFGAAIRGGHEEIVIRLLELGLPEYDDGLVIRASSEGHLSIVRLLLSAGALIDGHHAEGSECYKTALQSAVEGGYTEITSCLLSYGAEVNATWGITDPPLHLACQRNDLPTMKLLLDAGANVSSLSLCMESVYHIAEKGGSREILELLRDRGAETSVPNPQHAELDVSTVRKRDICSLCENMRWSRFMESEHYLGGRLVWHSCLYSLQESASHGCPVCMFFWKQFDIVAVENYPFLPPNKLLFENTRSSGSRTAMLVLVPLPKMVSKSTEFDHLNLEAVEEPFPGDAPLSGNTSSSTTSDKIRSWLSSCILDHPRCKIDIDSTFLPTRLLDLSRWDYYGVLRLVAGVELTTLKLRYMTLSHRWNENSKDAATTTSNIQARFDSIVINTLPLKFLDAIHVARNAQVDYLWIDTLCIVQDSRQDWERESSLMSEIYRNSYCTISANVSGKHSEGLFSYERNNDWVKFEYTSGSGKKRKVRFEKHRFEKDWLSLYLSGPLHERGWVLQERELSPRILYYTNSQVLWECRSWSASENKPTHDLSDFLRHSDREYCPRIFDSANTLRSVYFYDIWHRTVGDFTGRRLTYCEDTLPALSGLARMVGDYIKTEYIAGMWAGDLLRSLCWSIDPARYGPSKNGQSPQFPTRHSVYIAPSWSWASISGQSSYERPASQGMIPARPTNPTFSALPYTTAQRGWKKGMALILDYSVEHLGPDPFGRIKSGMLQVAAPVLTCLVAFKRYSSMIHGGSVLFDSTGDRQFGSLRFDVPSEGIPTSVVRIIYLTTDGLEEGLGLALLPVDGGESACRRVGLASGLDLKDFEDLPVEIFTII